MNHNDITYSDELLNDDEFMAKWHGSVTSHLDYHHAQYIERRLIVTLTPRKLGPVSHTHIKEYIMSNTPSSLHIKGFIGELDYDFNLIIDEKMLRARGIVNGADFLINIQPIYSKPQEAAIKTHNWFTKIKDWVTS